MIPRTAKKQLKVLAKTFPAVGVVGPRQSGKTTLVQEVFPKKPYVLLEDPDIREFATRDTRGFLEQYSNGAIFDEVQRVPQLFSYLQGVLDKSKKPGLFILTGSQNFLMMESITQSLAGRIALLTLLPLSMEEIRREKDNNSSFEEYIIKGFYPRIYDRKIRPKEMYANYVRTYIERDIRQLKNVQDLGKFQTFLKLCAHRTGQLVNLSSLANDCGIRHNTAKSWLSLLETSYIIHFLRPHHRNFNKRLVRAPKLHFVDVGLAAYLADIEDQKHLLYHPLRGYLFESFVVSELLKKQLNRGEASNLYFWRDKLGHEIDCLIDQGQEQNIVEIKSGKTITEDYFENIRYYSKLTKSKRNQEYLVYGGDQCQKRSNIQVLSWSDIYKIDV